MNEKNFKRMSSGCRRGDVGMSWWDDVTKYTRLIIFLNGRSYYSDILFYNDLKSSIDFF